MNDTPARTTSEVLAVASHDCLNLQCGEGDRGAGARENRGREGYGRRERKGREAGVLRGRAAGEKYETAIFLIQQCVRILSKTRT